MRHGNVGVTAASEREDDVTPDDFELGTQENYDLTEIVVRCHVPGCGWEWAKWLPSFGELRGAIQDHINEQHFGG